MAADGWDVRLASVEDADEVGRLLDDFNREFDTPTPGTAAIAARLRTLLATTSTFAILAGRPALGVALVTLRPNVWYDGLVALLDELYVEPESRSQGIGSAMIDELFEYARINQVDLIEINVDEGDVDAHRFYERHGFSAIEPTTNERAFYLHREL